MKMIKQINSDLLEKSAAYFDIEQQAILKADTIHILGIPFDGTVSFRTGARFGPNAIREASVGMESYSPYLQRDYAARDIIDLGNLPFYSSRQDLIHQTFDEIFSDVDIVANNIKLVTLGGEHSISYSPIKMYLNQYDNLVLLHLDAHTDLRNEWLEDKYSHACIIRRVLDHFGSKHRLIQYGIRSGTKEEFDWMHENDTLRTSLQDLCNELDNLDADRPIYLTLDLDFFDPAYFPGTGTPEAGGETFHGFIKLIKILAKKNFVGADIVELAPRIDPTDNSSVFAAKVTREILLALHD